jgi:stress-induced morphogen
VTADQIAAKIREALPDAEVALEDLTGTKDHWKLRVISTAFAGKSLMQRHRVINAALADELKGPIHALTMDVFTPDEVGAAPPDRAGVVGRCRRDFASQRARLFSVFSSRIRDDRVPRSPSRPNAS